MNSNNSPVARLDTKAAAIYSNVGWQTLAKFRVYGGGPKFIKIGRRVLYDTRDLDAWLESNKRTSNSDSGDA